MKISINTIQGDVETPKTLPLVAPLGVSVFSYSLLYMT